MTDLYHSLAETKTDDVKPPRHQLTQLEARVLYTVLHNSWIPVVASQEFRSAVVKLGILGGGFCCRDCSEIANHPHHLGGLVCEAHRPVKVA